TRATSQDRGGSSGAEGRGEASRGDSRSGIGLLHPIPESVAGDELHRHDLERILFGVKEKTGGDHQGGQLTLAPRTRRSGVAVPPSTATDAKAEEDDQGVAGTGRRHSMASAATPPSSLLGAVSARPTRG